jgi:hypothetical protein
MLTEEERKLVSEMRTLTSNPTVEYMRARDVPKLLDIIERLEARLKRAAELVPWMRHGRDGQVSEDAYRDCGDVLNAVLNETITVTVNARKLHTIAGNVATYEHLVHVAGMTGQPAMTVRCSDGYGRSLEPGQDIELADGLVVTCAHTGDS